MGPCLVEGLHFRGPCHRSISGLHPCKTPCSLRRLPLVVHDLRKIFLTHGGAGLGCVHATSDRRVSAVPLEGTDWEPRVRNPQTIAVGGHR